MIPVVADECFNGPLLAALTRRLPLLDAVRAQDAPVYGRPDTALLAWAADAGRVLLTHDAKTIGPPAYDRVARGLMMPGVVVVPAWLPIRAALDDLELTLSLDDADEFADRVRRVPL